VAHNHPGGSLTPSEQDLAMTRRLAAAGNTLGIELLDHIIFNARGYYSLKEHHQI
jgi:DNA repair protein RadC